MSSMKLASLTFAGLFAGSVLSGCLAPPETPDAEDTFAVLTLRFAT